MHKYGTDIAVFLPVTDVLYPFVSAVQYKLPERLRLQLAQSVTLKASAHVQGT
jgi:hypothetical protein